MTRARPRVSAIAKGEMRANGGSSRLSVLKSDEGSPYEVAGGSLTPLPPRAQRLPTSRNRASVRTWRLAWAGVGGLCAILLVSTAVLLVSQPSLTWATVVEQFTSARFVMATVCIAREPCRSR